MINLKEIAHNDGVLLFPTDTVYGIGVLPKISAIEKLYSIKNRDKNKKIIALVSSKDKIYEVIEKNEFIDKVIDKFLPGELTIVYKSNEKYSKLLGYDYIGVRIPNNYEALKLIDSLGGVIMTTSANFSGEEAVSQFSKIPKKLIESVDFYLENDENVNGLSSTVIKIVDNDIEVLREGNISIEEIYKLRGGTN